MKARFGTKLMIVIIALILLIFGAAMLYAGIRLNGISLAVASQDVVNDVIKVEKATFGAEGYWTLRRIILLAMGLVPLWDEADQLRHSAPEHDVRLIGDVKAVGTISEAVNGAFQAALHI